MDGPVGVMNSLRQVFETLNDLRARGVVIDYAIGGAMAVLFYAEPTRTYDVDVFVLLPPDGERELLSLQPLYAALRAEGYVPDAEHVVIHGVPVQFLPAFNPLVEEAIRAARLLDYEGVPVRVIGPDHLCALALQAGGRVRRERAWQLLESGAADRERLVEILQRHGLPIGDLS
jgi:hypothetical protein